MEQEAKFMPQHMVFPIYVDPIMPYAGNKVKKELGFVPLDEPLLRNVFKSNTYRKETKEFGRKLLLPAPEILLATKLNSVLNRDKNHKKQKDICDIVSLCLFSGTETDKLIKQSKKFVSEATLKKFRNANFENEIIHCSNTLGLERTTLKSILNMIKE